MADHDLAIDRLEQLATRTRDELLRLRRSRIEAAASTISADELSERLLDLSDEIDTQEKLLAAISAATSDARSLKLGDHHER